MLSAKIAVKIQNRQIKTPTMPSSRVEQLAVEAEPSLEREARAEHDRPAQIHTGQKLDEYAPTKVRPERVPISILSCTRMRGFR